MAYASASDVEVELGRPANSAEETLQWEAWLERVERTIRRGFTRAGFDLDAQVVLNDPTSEDVIDVEVGAVLRKITNPSGVTSSTRSVDDASVTNRWEGFTGGDPLGIGADEWANLLPAGRKRPQAFSVMPS